MKKILLIGVCALLVSGVSCKKQGSMEKAGERTDEIIDNVQEGKPLLHKKGPAEKTGEAIDEAISGEKK